MRYRKPEERRDMLTVMWHSLVPDQVKVPDSSSISVTKQSPDFFL